MVQATGKRDEIFLATKFAFCKGAGIGKMLIDSSGKYCKEACEASLQRLGVESIDLCECLDCPLLPPGLIASDRLRPSRQSRDAHRGDHESASWTPGVSVSAASHRA